jgi:hypothetical protein
MKYSWASTTRGTLHFHCLTNNSKESNYDEKSTLAQNGMEKCTNQISADVASKRLNKLLVENTDIPTAPFLPDLTQIPPSLAAAQIISFQKSALFAILLTASVFLIICSLDCKSALHLYSCHCSESRVWDVRFACIIMASIISVHGSGAAIFIDSDVL